MIFDFLTQLGLGEALHRQASCACLLAIHDAPFVLELLVVFGGSLELLLEQCPFRLRGAGSEKDARGEQQELKPGLSKESLW